MNTEDSRIAVLETEVKYISQDVTELKGNVKDMHDCLDRTRDELKAKLDSMNKASNEQHDMLANEIKAIKILKNKILYLSLGGLAVIGWVSGHLDLVNKLFN
jgi:uncharacterized coiled-coil protein SlyX